MNASQKKLIKANLSLVRFPPNHSDATIAGIPKMKSQKAAVERTVEIVIKSIITSLGSEKSCTNATMLLVDKPGKIRPTGVPSWMNSFTVHTGSAITEPSRLKFPQITRRYEIGCAATAERYLANTSDCTCVGVHWHSSCSLLNNSTWASNL